MKRTAFAAPFLAVLVVSGLAPEPAYAVVRLVKPDGTGDAPTIQAAVNASSPGDSVLLADGVFTGNGNRGVDFGGREIVVTSQHGPEATIVDAQGANRGFEMDFVGPGGELSNITIRNGNSNEGAAITMANASPTISGLILAGNHSSWLGGGIHCEQGSSPTIRGCIILGNTANYGGGIYSNDSAPVIENCTIVENAAITAGAGVRIRNATGGLITKTIIAFNLQTGGLECTSMQNFTVSCTNVFGNEGGDALCGFDGGNNFSAEPRFCGAPGSGIVSIEGHSPCAPGESPCGSLVGAVAPACALGPEIADTPNTLYPNVTFAGEPGLVVHVGLDNFSYIGVMLDETSNVVFSDSVDTFVAGLANQTYVPGNARNFTATFFPTDVPAGMTAPASYDLRLNLEGVDDSAAVYSASITTPGTNSILVDTPKVIVSSLPVGVAATLPGSRNAPILALSFQNGYASARSLDSLTVVNRTFGPGTPAERDSEIENAYLFDDADSTGTLTPPDLVVAQSVFSSGRADFALAGAWSLAAYEAKNLIVAGDVDSTLAHDGDLIDAVVVSPGDVVFQGPTQINQDFSPLYPLDSFGYAVVDGMVRHQIGIASAAIDTLIGGTPDVGVLTLVVPQNGYAPDTLEALSIRDYAGDFAPGDFATLRVYRDDGDGVFEPALDTGLGGLVFSGDRYQISGLSEPLAPPARFFIAADVANHAVGGHHFRPGVPLGGIEVKSANDGPIDSPAVSGKSYLIENPDVVEVTNLPFTPGSSHPGSRDVRLLFFSVGNSALQPVTLDTLRFTNHSRGLGTTAELDQALTAVRIYRDDGNGILDGSEPVLADGLAFAGGSLAVQGFGLGVAVDEIVTLLVAADIDSFCSADGDTLEIRIDRAADVGILEDYPVTGAFPAATPGTRIVDGMKAFQIAMFPGADSLIVAGGAHVLLLDVGVPANGYAADVLQTIIIRNEGTATSEHIASIGLFADGGNGTFDDGSGDDTHLGNFVENPAEPGKSFLLAGLSLPLAGSCGIRTRLYAAAVIAQDYSVAGTLRFSIPVMGLSVASGNDGPIDAPVIEPSMTLIPKPDRLTVFPYPVGDTVAYPASKRNFNSGVGLYNGYSTPLTLGAITLYQVGTASSDEIDSVFVHADSDANGLFNPPADAPIAAASANGVTYTFGGIGVGLESRKITYLFFTYDLAKSVTDSSSVDLGLFGPSDISVQPTGSLVEGAFPINSPGIDIVNGMVSAQIAVGNAPPYNASRLNVDIPALTLLVPANGIWEDRLDFLSAENQGSAAPGTDIVSMRLWREAGGDPERFDAGVEEILDELDWNGSNWRNSTALRATIPVSGLRVHVTFSVSANPTDGATVRARVPIGGITVYSGNDGPIDSPVVNPSEQTLSTDPLISSLGADRPYYSAGQEIVLSMVSRNEGLDTLFAVHPSLVASSGTASVSLNSTPVPPAVDLPPATATTFVWTYTAVGAGDLTFCGRAYSADSLVASEETCSAPSILQNRASGVSATLTNLAPSSANRGQDGIRFLRLDAAYASSDTLDAPVNVTGLRLRFEDAAGFAVAPNSVLERVVIVDPEGADQAFSVTDSTGSTLEFTMSQPVSLAPGGLKSLYVDGDVADAAAFTTLALRIAAIDDLRIRDANDGAPAARTSTTAFPWTTTPLVINSAADELLVDAQDPMSTSANVGQENVRVLTLQLTHPGDSHTAAVILYGFRLDFFDLFGGPIQPSAVLKRFRVFSGAAVLYDADVVSGPSTSLSVTLATPLVVSPASTRAVDFVVDLKSVPTSQGFYLLVSDPSSVVARDINTGQLIAAAPENPPLRAFPFSSDLVAFQNPASGILTGYTETIPSVILPGSLATPVMDVIVSHQGEPGASSVRVDSLALGVSFFGGGPASAGDYFSSLFVTHDGDTVGSVTSLGGGSSVVECKLGNPIVLAPSEIETLSVHVDVKSAFTPATIEVRIDQPGLAVYDTNDGSRIFALSGPFPFVAGPASLQISAGMVSVGVISRLPSNITAGESNFPVFDVILKNGESAGYSAVSLDAIRIRVHVPGLTGANPGRIAAGARFVTRDDAVVEGVITVSEIVFNVPRGVVEVSSGESDTLRFFVDFDADIDDETFRFAIEEAAAIEATDAAAGGSVAVGTIGGARFPLATNWAHVLGSSLETAYTNYPNPFAAGREHTTITYYLQARSRVTLKLYTLWGAPVATLIDNRSQNAGLYQNVTWDGRNGDGHVVNNGVYFLVLEIREDGGRFTSLKRKVGVVR
jgi:hypothetical protein